jgi:hypothetical protein
VTLREFAELVKLMRDSQRDYASFSARKVQRHVRAVEDMVDRALEDVLAPGRTTPPPAPTFDHEEG